MRKAHRKQTKSPGKVAVTSVRGHRVLGSTLWLRSHDRACLEGLAGSDQPLAEPQKSPSHDTQACVASFLVHTSTPCFLEGQGTPQRQRRDSLWVSIRLVLTEEPRKTIAQAPLATLPVAASWCLLSPVTFPGGTHWERKLPVGLHKQEAR